MHRTLRSLSLLALFWLAGCGRGLCVEGCISGPQALLSASFSGFDFGAKAFGSQTTGVLTLTNTGAASARLLGFPVSPPFSFEGGAFPGLGGTCEYELLPGASCSLALVYAPVPPVSADTFDLRLSYFDGSSNRELVLTLSGQSDNGVFNRAQGLDYVVQSLAVTSQGVVVGGGFMSVLDQRALGLARLRSSSEIDPSFVTGEGFGSGSSIDTIAPALDGSGDLYIGGNFTSYNGTADVNRIVRLNSDGSIDAGFNIGTGVNAGFNLQVYSIAPALDGSGDVYVGGSFSTYNGTPNVNRIARLNSDGTLDAGFNIGVGAGAGFNGIVQVVAPATDGSGDVYVGGHFTGYNGTANKFKIIRLNSNGTNDAVFNIGAGATAGFGALPVYSIAAATDGSGDIYVGGQFTTYNTVANVRRIVRLNSNGTIDAGFNIGAGATAGFNNTVRNIAIATDGTGDVYVGGQFTSYNTIANVNRIARFNPDGTLDSGFNFGSGTSAGFNAQVNFIVPTSTDKVHVGGNFLSYNGTFGVKYVAQLNPDGTLDPDFNRGMGSSAGFDSEINSIIHSADLSGDIYVGGTFTSYDGTSNVNRIARLNSDGSLDSGFSIGTGTSAGFDGDVAAMVAASDGSGDIYVGGFFTEYNGTAGVNFIARLNSDGSLDTGFSTGTGFAFLVYCLALAPDGSGDLYVGGEFTSYDGVASNYLIRLNSDGSVDTGFNIGVGIGSGFGTAVHAMAAATDGSGDLYVAGNFSSYNGTADVRRIVRLNSDGSLDAGFNIGTGASAGFNAIVRSIALAKDGSEAVYVGGNFTSYDGTADVRRIARLNSGGSLDTGFNIGAGGTAGFNAEVYTLAPAIDGSSDLYVGGVFATYNGTSFMNRLARLNSDGTLDTAFNIGTGASAGVNWIIYSILPASDGSNDVYVAGGFSTYSGRTVDNLVRLSATGAAD